MCVRFGANKQEGVLMLNGSLYIPFKTNSDFLTESANYFNNSIFIVNRGLESLLSSQQFA